MSKSLKSFINLHGHSSQSLRDALGKPDEIIKEIQSKDMNASALTEHGNMNSLADFYFASKDYKFKPIFGQEFYFIRSHKEWRELAEKHRQEKEKGKKVEKEKGFKEDDQEVRSSKRKNPLKYYNHLILLAQSWKGLQNIFALTYHAHKPENFYYFPRIDFDLLQQFNEDVICLSSCCGGVMAMNAWRDDLEGPVEKRLDDLYKEFHNIFGKDRFYLELQFNSLDIQHITNRELIKCAQRNDAHLVATADFHYPKKELWKEREMMKALAFDRETYTQSEEELKCLLYPKDAQEMLDAARNYCSDQDYYDEDTIIEAINNSAEIEKNLINHFELDTSRKLEPLLEYKKSPDDELKSLVKEKLKGLFESDYWKNNNFDKQTYLDRAIKELSIIKQTGQAAYFLNVYELVNLGRKHMIVGAGRGSGAGSLICYLLDITRVDPIKYNLIFERFVNPSRDGDADIDTDFADVEYMEELVRDHFGDVIYPISTYMKMKLKSVIKDVAKINGVDFSEVNKVTKKMMNEAYGAIRSTGENKSLLEITWDLVYPNSPTLQNFIKKYPHLEKPIKVLYGTDRNVGTHAGGKVLSKNPQFELPVQNVKGRLQTAYTEGIANKNLAKMGFIKIDNLGLATLVMQDECVKLICERYNKNYDEFWKSLQPEYIDFDDKKVYETVYHEPKNMTQIFQFTESGARNFCKKVKPYSLEEIAVITSIYRPGPMDMNVHKKYAKVKHSNEKIEYEHPILEKILGSTYGFLVFQEQMMQIGHELGQLNLQETDKLRKLILKKDMSAQDKESKELKVLYEKFIEGCKRNDLTKEQADEIWLACKAQSGYSFNKSHALAYSIVSYQCAFLRTYYPDEWLCAVLNVNDSEKVIQEIRAQDYKILQPDINLSDKRWTIDQDKSLRIGLKSVKGLGDKVIEKIISNKSYDSVKDFVLRSGVNKKALESLIKSEAFESVKNDFSGFENYAHMYRVLPEFKSKIKNEKSFDKVYNDTYDLCDKEEWSQQERIQNSIEMLGFYDKTKVVDDYKELLLEYNVQSVDSTEDNKNKINVWGIVEDVKEKRTKKGKPYLIVNVSGETMKQYSFRIWNKSIERTNTWIPGSIVIFSLDYDSSWGYNLNRNSQTIKVS